MINAHYSFAFIITSAIKNRKAIFKHTCIWLAGRWHFHFVKLPHLLVRWLRPLNPHDFAYPFRCSQIGFVKIKRGKRTIRLPLFAITFLFGNWLAIQKLLVGCSPSKNFHSTPCHQQFYSNQLAVVCSN